MIPKQMSFLDDENDGKGAPPVLSPSGSQTFHFVPRADEVVTDNTCVNCRKSINHVPRLLSCLHTMCSECVEILQDKNKNTLPCSLCSSVTNLPAGSTVHLNADCVTLINHEYTLLSADKLMCGFCDPDAARAASHYCNNCYSPLCSVDANNHKRIKAFGSHKLTLLDKQKMHSCPLSKDVRVCMEHDEKDYGRFCETCETPVCQVCEDTNHVGHRFVPFINAGNNARTAVDQELKVAHGSIKRVSDAISLIEHTSAEIKEKEEKITQSIKSETEAIIRCAQDRERRLLNALIHQAAEKQTDLKSQKMSLQSQLSSLQFAAEYAAKSLRMSNENNGEFQLLWVKRPLYSRLSTLQVRNDIAPVCNSFIELQQGNERTQAVNLINKSGQIVVINSNLERCRLIYHTTDIKMGETFCVMLLQLDKSGAILMTGHVEPFVTLQYNDGSADTITPKLEDDGRYSISFTPSRGTTCELSVHIRNQHIEGSPIQFKIVKPDTHPPINEASHVHATSSTNPRVDLSASYNFTSSTNPFATPQYTPSFVSAPQYTPPSVSTPQYASNALFTAFPTNGVTVSSIDSDDEEDGLSALSKHKAVSNMGEQHTVSDPDPVETEENKHQEFNHSICGELLELSADSRTVTKSANASRGWNSAVLGSLPNQSYKLRINSCSRNGLMIGLSPSHDFKADGEPNHSVRGYFFSISTRSSYRSTKPKKREYANNITPPQNGSIIEVVYDRIQGTISYIIDGNQAGVAFDAVPSDVDLYPAVELPASGDSVQFLD